MPIIFEIVDFEEMIRQLLPFPDEHVSEGLISM
jgi:PII-like signaling protein